MRKKFYLEINKHKDKYIIYKVIKYLAEKNISIRYILHVFCRCIVLNIFRYIISFHDYKNKYILII
jgi:hypothetical protein